MRARWGVLIIGDCPPLVLGAGGCSVELDSRRSAPASLSSDKSVEAAQGELAAESA